MVVVEPHASNRYFGSDAASYPVEAVDVDKQIGQAKVLFTVRVVGDAGSHPKEESPFAAIFKRIEDVVTTCRLGSDHHEQARGR